MKKTNYSGISAESLAALVDQLEITQTLPIVIGLIGDLGAGKTTLVKFIAESLEIDPQTVCSPSYNLLNEYAGPKYSMEHWDLYRLDYLPEELNFKPEEAQLRIIEWSNLIEEPKGILDYEIKIEINAEGSRDYLIREVAK